MADLFSGSYDVNPKFYTSGNNFKIGNMQLPGVTTITGQTVPVTKETNLNSKKLTSSRERSTKNDYSINTNTNLKRTDYNKRNVSQNVLDLMNRRAGAIEQDATLNAADAGKRAAIQAAMQALTSFDAEAIQRGAEGDVDLLRRQLLEEIMPGITGAVEASGTSNNALAALTANDAAIRTAEAQARVREQARQNAAQELNSLITGTTQASDVGSSMQDAISQFLNASKGAVEQGYSQDFSRSVQEAINRTTRVLEKQVAEEATGRETTTDYETLYDMQNAQENQHLAKLAALQALLPAGINMADAFGNNAKFGGVNGSQFRRSIRNLRGAVGI